MDCKIKNRLIKTIIYLPVAVLALIFIVFVVKVVYFSKTMGELEAKNNTSLLTSLTKQTQQQILIDNNYWLGTNSPKITIVEFADFACLYCKNFSYKLRRLLFKYPQDIKFVYKDFPVVNEWSIPLSLAGRCAGEQGAFWEMHDELFEMQGLASPDNVGELAAALNIDPEQFNECVLSEKYFKDIQRDAKEGELLGARNTPTIFINGYMIAGDISENILNKIIEEFLEVQ